MREPTLLLLLFREAMDVDFTDVFFLLPVN